MKLKICHINIIPDYLKIGGESEWYIMVKRHWWNRWEYLEPTYSIPPMELHPKDECIRILKDWNRIYEQTKR